jgi:MFS family permease
VFGCITAIDNPARQSFVSELVPEDDIPNAVGLNSASFNFARLLGPGTAGLLIAFVGIAPAFFINTASFAAVMIALRLMKSELLNPAKRVVRGKGQLRAGLRYVRGEPRILLLLVIVFFFGTFCMNFQITNALMAVQVFHKGAGEYGLLGSIMAIGSLSAALLAARRKVPSLRVLIIALVGFAVTSTIAGLAPNYVVFAIALIPLGLSALTVMTTANASVQLAAEPQMRGRVMALYMAVFMGGTPIGSPIIGWVGEAFGARWTILIGSIVALLVAVAATLTLMRRRKVSMADLSGLAHIPARTH